MNILVVGATGMTGRLLVKQLLGKNYKVRIIVRSTHKLPSVVVENPNTTTIESSVLDLTDEEVTEHVKDCDAVVSCLGHVMNFKGIFGEPKKLCTDATRNLCKSLEKRSLTKPTKFILVMKSLQNLLKVILSPHTNN